MGVFSFFPVEVTKDHENTAHCLGDSEWPGLHISVRARVKSLFFFFKVDVFGNINKKFGFQLKNQSQWNNFVCDRW